MNQRQSVAILFGGKSVEHSISIKSAINVAEYLDAGQYAPLYIGISQQGQWFLKDKVDDDFSQGVPLALSLDPAKKGFINLKENAVITPDIIFPVLHGTDGEDGSIQGMLKAIDIPFVGTDVLGSAVAMSKLCSKQLLEASGIPVNRYLSYNYHERESISYEKIKETLGLPFMVKAANLGSSVGIHKVKEREEFAPSVLDAFKFDSTVIFEQYIEGRELECSVIGNDIPEVSLPAEIVIDKSRYDFYDYDAKYMDPDAVQLQVPAKLDALTTEKIRKLSIKAYKALQCNDFARVDLFLTPKGDIYINEINTIPGFTNVSMFPMMWQERGVAFTPLLTRLIEMAMKRYKGNKRMSQEFKSSKF